MVALSFLFQINEYVNNSCLLIFKIFNTSEKNGLIEEILAFWSELALCI